MNMAGVLIYLFCTHTHARTQELALRGRKRERVPENLLVHCASARPCRFRFRGTVGGVGSEQAKRLLSLPGRCALARPGEYMFPFAMSPSSPLGSGFALATPNPVSHFNPHPPPPAPHPQPKRSAGVSAKLLKAARLPASAQARKRATKIKHHNSTF